MAHEQNYEKIEKNSIREVRPDDSKRIWEIRNHPESRKYSGSPDVILLKNHISWFEKKYFSGQDSHCFILESEGKEVIGYCRFDYDEESDCYIISIAVDPGYHKKGLGTKFLRETLEKFKTSKAITAEIQKENIASVKLFEKNNFEVQNEDEKNYFYKYIPKN